MRFLINKLARAITGVSVLIMGSSVVVLLYQAYLWLKHDEWRQFSLQTTLGQYLTSPWLHDPKDWRGLHKLVVTVLHLPLFLVIFVSGLAIYFAGRWMITALRKLFGVKAGH